MILSEQDIQKLWGLIKLSLAKKFQPELYKAWIEHGTKLSDIVNEKVTLDVRNSLTLQWLEKYAKSILNEIFAEFLGGKPEIILQVKSASFQSGAAAVQKKEEPGKLLDAQNAYEVRLKKAIEESGMNEKYTFDSFIIGNNNQLAHAAATAVAGSLGSAYNPLFIYGTVGVGKTHLMQAVGRKILEKDPDKKVYYCSSETFLNAMIESIHAKKTAEFRNQYRKLDLLMIDDIQLISTWEAAQNELFHTFNTLHQAGKQVILASDRPPAEINNLAERLRSRFEGGMVADITTPDYETRVAILTKFNDLQDPRLPQEALEIIGASVENNVRQLIGSYNKVHTYMKVTNAPVDKLVVEKILGHDREMARRRIKVEDVLDKVSTEFQVPVSQLKSSTRAASIALPRQVCMFLIRDILNYPLEKVARALKRSDHTTVLHAIEKVNKLMANDHHLRAQIVAIKNELLK